VLLWQGEAWQIFAALRRTKAGRVLAMAKHRAVRQWQSTTLRGCGTDVSASYHYNEQVNGLRLVSS